MIERYRVFIMIERYRVVKGIVLNLELKACHTERAHKGIKGVQMCGLFSRQTKLQRY